MAPKRPVHLVQSEVWLGRTEFEDLIRQRGPETVEAPRYPATGTKAIEVRPLVGRPSRVASVAPLFAPLPATGEDDGLIRLDGLEPAQVEAGNRPSAARSRRFPRWATAGVLGLAVAGSAAAVPLLTSDGGAARVTAGNATPAKSVPAIPSPGPGDDRSSEPIEAGQMAPVAAPNLPAEASVHSEPAAAPAASHARHDTRTTAPPNRAASTPTPPPASQVALEEAFKWWSEAAGSGARNPRWTHFGPESPHWP